MKRALLITATALLAVPAGASAATTYTVHPGESIAAALAQAGDGDTVHVLAGTYTEQPLTVSHAVRIEGDPGTVVANASADASKALFTFTADGGALSTMTAASTAGPVVVGQAADLTLSGALIISAAGAGPGLRFEGSGTSSIVRSSVAAIAPGADAVQVQSTTTGDRTLSIDSSILSGGANAASLRASTSNSVLTLNTGNITVHAVHATLAGAAAAVATQVTSIGIGSPGTIAVGVDRSIVRGATGDGVTVINSDPSAADIFVNAGAKDFHLRADAPVIDQGGPAVGGESDRDVDGQPRVAGAATDLGADEFVNQAPVARLATPAPIRTPGAVNLDATGSSDPEAASGGGIASYHFDFGDGAAVDALTPSAGHAYPKPGTYTASVTVTDAQGLSTTSMPVQVQVLDGIAPAARIISPRNGRKLRLRTKRHKLAAIRFTGSASDETGIAAVGLTLRRIGTTKLTNIKVRVAQGIWSYKVPSKRKLKRGRYELKAYAVDTAGNVSKAARTRFTLK
jgi:hypothetical protein